MVKHKDIPKLPVFIRDDEPLRMDMEAGKYFWCACGRTRKGLTFCDGSHHKTGIRPVRIVLEEDQEVYWCMCKHTSTPPFCDGSHENVKGCAGKLAKDKE